MLVLLACLCVDCSQKPEEDFRSFGMIATGNCEPSDMGAVGRITVPPARAANTSGLSL